MCVNDVELSISVCYSVTLCLGVKLWELFNLNPCLCMAAWDLTKISLFLENNFKSLF